MLTSILFVIPGLLAAGEDTPRLQIQSSADGRVVTVVAEPANGQIPDGLSEKLTGRQGEAILTLRLVDPDGDVGAPILGDYRRVGSHLYFKPRCQLVAGYDYRATLYDADGQSVSLQYGAPRQPVSPAAVVEQVFPSSRLLPANQMKFYLHFSKPMREGRNIFDHIHLLNEDGSKVPDPWRRTELWTEDARRLTLWIHPGRIKTGVNLRQELGPVLLPGRHYSLLIDSSMQDADGQSLAKRFTKTFETTTADSERPQPSLWSLGLPQIATRQRLKIHFRESLDHVLLKRFLEVRDSNDNLVSGQIQIGEKETDWSLKPRDPWSDEDYRLIVDPLLEDLAGNTPVRVFDADLNAAEIQPPILKLKFRPRSREPHGTSNPSLK